MYTLELLKKHPKELSALLGNPNEFFKEYFFKKDPLFNFLIIILPVISIAIGMERIFKNQGGLGAVLVWSIFIYFDVYFTSSLLEPISRYVIKRDKLEVRRSSFKDLYSLFALTSAPLILSCFKYIEIIGYGYFLLLFPFGLARVFATPLKKTLILYASTIVILLLLLTFEGFLLIPVITKSFGF